ncbi:hypothetical protein M885DRAFT_520925 [Pelagophyceae sp. CCMP2097]|nr:hypothetical protein M885DRAFT_520925 [Pelagophyceae sp. CCMP2097]
MGNSLQTCLGPYILPAALPLALRPLDDVKSIYVQRYLAVTGRRPARPTSARQAVGAAPRQTVGAAPRQTVGATPRIVRPASSPGARPASIPAACARASSPARPGSSPARSPRPASAPRRAPSPRARALATPPVPRQRRRDQTVGCSLSLHAFKRVFYELKADELAGIFRLLARETVDGASVDVREILAVMIVTAMPNNLHQKAMLLVDLFRGGADAQGDRFTRDDAQRAARAVVAGLARFTGAAEPLAGDVVEAYVDAALPAVVFPEGDASEAWAAFVRQDAAARFLAENFGTRRAVGGRAHAHRISARRPTTPLRWASGSGVARPPRSAFAGYPNMLREVQRVLAVVREVFDSIESCAQGAVAIDEFIDANSLRKADATAAVAKGGAAGAALLRFGAGIDGRTDGARGAAAEQFTVEMFAALDVDGDGRVTWREVVAGMYGRFGPRAVDELAGLDLEGVLRPRPPPPAQRGRSDDRHSDALRALFAQYDLKRRGSVAVEDLAQSMAKMHDVEASDLLGLFAAGGRGRLQTVDQSQFVTLFRDLELDDASFAGLVDDDEAQADHLDGVEERHAASRRASVASRAHLNAPRAVHFEKPPRPPRTVHFQQDGHHRT